MQKKQILFIISLFFAIIITIFALANANLVAINLFFFNFEASLALVIFISVMIGAIIITLLGISNYFKLKNEIKRLTEENQELNKIKEELITTDNSNDKTESSNLKQEINNFLEENPLNNEE